MASNGNGGNGHDGGNGPRAPDDALPPAAARFADEVRESMDRQLALFRNVVTMSETAGADYLKALAKLGHGVTERLREQDHEIAALKKRLDAVEARQAEAGKPAP